MPVDLALDLVALALYDIVIYADDSTSMKYAENGSRIDDLKMVLERVTEVATLLDEDGQHSGVLLISSIGAWQHWSLLWLARPHMHAVAALLTITGWFAHAIQH